MEACPAGPIAPVCLSIYFVDSTLAWRHRLLVSCSRMGEFPARMRDQEFSAKFQGIQSLGELATASA